MLDSSKCILVATFQVFPTIFLLQIFALVKAVFEDSSRRVNVSCSALCGLQGMMDAFIYLFQLLTVFSNAFFLSWDIILLKNPKVSHRNVGGVWLLLLKEICISLLRTLKSKSSYLELNEIKMMVRNLIFKILFNIFLMS